MTVRLEQDWLGMEREGDEGIAERYGELPDLRLMELARVYEELTETAKAALHAEFARRELAWPEVKVEPAAARYGRMSNHGLLRVAQGYEGLSEEERGALRDEFNVRGLEVPAMEEDEPEESAEEAETEAEPVKGAADDAEEFVTVRSFRDLPDAIVARSMLEMAEIPCALRDEHTVGMNWQWSNAVGGVRLQVPAASLEAAEAVLAQPVPPAFATDGGEYVQPVCPKCGSLDVMADDLDRKIKLTSTVANGLPLVIGLPALAFVRKGAWKCLACECRWVDDAEAVSTSASEA